MIFFKFSKVLFSVVGSLDKKLVGTSIKYIFSVLFIWVLRIAKLYVFWTSLLNYVPNVPNVPTCHDLLRANVPTCLRAKFSYVPTCHDMLRAIVPTCLRAKFFYVPTCHDMLRANVPTCLRAKFFYVPTCHDMWRANVPTCLRAYVSNFLTCQRAVTCHVPTCLRAKLFYVPTWHCMLPANMHSSSLPCANLPMCQFVTNRFLFMLIFLHLPRVQLLNL